MTNTTPPIEGKVAQILNARELVINIGAGQGVRKGMKFAILASTALDIKDPDTDELIGIIDREKVRVEAAEVQDRLTVCSTYEVTVVGGALFMPSVSELLGPPREVPKTLKAADSAYPAPLSPDESYVKIGDRVRRVG